jgi:hypothetical protein
VASATRLGCAEVNGGSLLLCTTNTAQKEGCRRSACGMSSTCCQPIR